MSWKATMINIHQYLQDQIQPFLLLSMLPSCSPIVPCICHLQLETATTCSKKASISSKDLLQWSAPKIYIIWVSPFPLLSSPVTAVLHQLNQQSIDLSSFLHSNNDLDAMFLRNSKNRWPHTEILMHMLLYIQLLISSNEANLILLPPNPTKTMFKMITCSVSYSYSSSSSSVYNFLKIFPASPSPSIHYLHSLFLNVMFYYKHDTTSSWEFTLLHTTSWTLSEDLRYVSTGYNDFTQITYSLVYT